VKVMQRRATIAVALTLGLLSSPAVLRAQSRALGPDPNTPRLLVAVFSSPERLLGVQVADAIRSRITAATSIRQLYVTPKQDITTYLETSGYRADSALGRTDLEALAKLLRADEVLTGTVTRTPSGLRVAARFALPRDVRIAQPLPVVEGSNANDVARTIERAFQEARKQRLENQQCENFTRSRDYQKAIAAAQAAIAKYPNATIARLCLASVYQEMKMPDSVIKVTEEIRRIDPQNSLALSTAFLAYQQKNDAENSLRALMSLFRLEPTNQTLSAQIVQELAKLGRPAVALPIIDTLLMQSPGDPQLLRQKWFLSLQVAAAADSASRAAAFGRAVSVGEELIRSDSTQADSVFFARQIIAANVLTPPRGLEFASRAVQKFPNSAEFWALKGNAERKAGQLQMAQQSIQRALTIDPKYPQGNLILAQIFIDLNQPDSVTAVARRAVAAGEDAKTWAGVLLSPAQAAVKAAQEAKTDMSLFEKALAISEESQRLSSSDAAQYFIGVTSFSVAASALQDAQKSHACASVRKAQDMLLKTQTSMPQGGRIDPNTARIVLSAVPDYNKAAEQMARAYCR